MQEIKIKAVKKDRQKELHERLEKIYQKNDTPAKISSNKDMAEKSDSHQRRIQKEDFLYFWRAREYEKKERSRNWIIICYLILLGLVVYAFFTNNLLMSILFILIGFVFYIFEKRQPEEHTFGITHEGIFAEDQIYEFSSLKNFWIFYNPNGLKELSLESDKKFLPFIEIPLGSANPLEIRKILIKFLPEEEHHKPFLHLLTKYID